MMRHVAAPNRGPWSRLGRCLRASVVGLAAGLASCGDLPATGPANIDLTQLEYGVVDGRFTRLDVVGTGLRHATRGDLDVFVDLPARPELAFELAEDVGRDRFGVLVRTNTGEQAIDLRRDASGTYRAALPDTKGTATQLRFTNRSTEALTWLRPRVEGTFPAPAVRYTTASRPKGKRYNVLLYVIDTLRADHLSCYGYHRATSPRIDDMATRGTLFTSAYSMASSTPPSMASIFASRHPSELRSRLDPDGPAQTTLAETFQRAGWATAGFQANLLLRRPLGFARGFDHYEIPSRRPAKKVRAVRAEALHELVLNWLAERPAAPFFIWVQSMDVHDYDPVPPFAGRYTNPDGGTTTTTRAEDVDNPFTFMYRFTPEYYDETVAYADHHLGRLLDEMQTMGVLEDTIVIVTSDHGEPLGEHGTYFHGVNVFEEVIHVPLLVLLPWDAGAQRITAITSLVDLAPTILDLAGLAAPAEWQGRSLLGPPPLHQRPTAIGATEGMKAQVPSWFLRTGPWKVVMDREKTQLFHLPTDPDEETDVAHRHPVTAQALSSALLGGSPEFRAGWTTPPPWDADLDPGEKARLHEALEALGYTR